MGPIWLHHWLIEQEREREGEAWAWLLYIAILEQVLLLSLGILGAADLALVLKLGLLGWMPMSRSERLLRLSMMRSVSNLRLLLLFLVVPLLLPVGLGGRRGLGDEIDAGTGLRRGGHGKLGAGKKVLVPGVGVGRGPRGLMHGPQSLGYLLF